MQITVHSRLGRVKLRVTTDTPGSSTVAESAPTEKGDVMCFPGGESGPTIR